MTTRQQPPRDEPVRNLVPTFSPPPPEDPTLSSTSTETLERVAEGLSTDRSPDQPPTPRPFHQPQRHLQLPQRRPGAAMAGDHMPSSATTGEDVDKSRVTPSVDETVTLAVAALAFLGAAAALAVRFTLKAKLRQPTDKQARQIARPLVRIALRHFDALVVNTDLADALKAGAATANYVNAGPLLGPLGPDTDPQVPDLNDTDEE